jgi:hypothetical protein
MNFAIVNGQRVPIDEPNTVGTFARHIGAQLNPVSAVEAVGHAVAHPIDTVTAIGAAQGALFDKAKASYDKGDYGTAARHFVDYLLPLIGPPLDKAADASQAGHVAAGAGDAVGLGLAMFGPQALKAGASSLARSSTGQAVADAADAASTRRVVNVIAPKIGPNRVRFGNMAEDVAPAVARQTTGLTRAGVADSITSNLDDATAALDAAANARNARIVTSTKPILARLQAMRDRLTAQTAQAGGVSAGSNVVPAPNRARVAVLDQAMQELRDLGAYAKYEPLRRIREAYDGPAKAIYSPSMTADYLTAQGSKLGAADVTSAIRDHLATMDPNTAAANAKYSLWKKASDVITAAEETQRIRPTVGRTIMARGLGAATGGSIDGGLGAAVGAMIGPMIERTLTGLAPAAQLIVARRLAMLADAVRAGNVGQFRAIVSTLERMVPTAAVVRSSGMPMALPTAAQAGQQP